VRHFQLTLPDTESWAFTNVRATLRKESSYKLLTYTRGSKSVRQDYQFSLLGEGALVELKGLAELSGQRQAHTSVLVDHQAPHTRSQQLYKQILTDAAQGSFMGKILVQPLAQQTQAYQLNKNLILSPRAQSFSKPNLEIFADDVKASHGATVSQLDEAQLFYLKTRGLSDDEARALLISGFSKEIISQIPLWILKSIFPS
jgi:Fe-S cluster assembly protein SufD